MVQITSLWMPSPSSGEKPAVGGGSRWGGERGRAVGRRSTGGGHAQTRVELHRCHGDSTELLWVRHPYCHKACARFPTIHRPYYYSHLFHNEHGNSGGESETR